jgi:hypothetical protein
MATTLGGVTLSDHLILLGIESAPGVAWSARRTLGGRQVVQVGPRLVGGRELILQSENHLTRANLLAVKALEVAGVPVALVHPRGTFSVLITAIDVEADFDFVNPDATGAAPWYSGTISLIEV